MFPDDRQELSPSAALGSGKRIEPLLCVSDGPQNGRRPRLLEQMLLMLMPLTLLCGAIQWWARPTTQLHFYVVLGAVALGGVALVLNRMKCYRQAAFITCMAPLLGSFASLAATPEEFIAFAYPSVGIILASMFLTSRSTIALTVLSAGALFVLPLIQPAHAYTTISAALGFNLFVPILIVSGMANRDREEQDRREALLRSEERWRMLVEHHPDPISIAINGRYVWVNDPCMDLFAATHARDVVGRATADFAHESCHESLRSRITQLDAGQRTIPLPFRMVALDGQERRVEASSVPIVYGGEKAAITVLRNVTDQWQAEQKLKESEARYRAIVEHAPEATVVVDLATGFFVDCNTNAERLFGLNSPTMAASGPVELSPGEQPDGQSSQEAWNRYVNQAISGELGAFEWTFVGPNASVPCEVRLVRLPSQHGLLIRGSITDITKKLESEAALRVSEQRHRTLIEGMNDGLIAVDLDQRVTVVNDRVREMFGFGEPMLGRSIREFVDLDGEAELIRQGELRRMGNTEPYELTARRANGAPIEVRVSPSAITDAQGNHVGSFGVIRDVTESKRLEEKRCLAEAKIRSVVENATDLITVLDGSGRIVFASPSLERMLGHGPEDLMGRYATEFVHEDDVAQVLMSLKKGAANPGVPQLLEIRLLHRNGSWVTVETVGKVLPESLDDWQVVVHSRDITERRRLEQELLSVSNREQRRFGRDLHDGMGQVLVAARLYSAGLEKKLRRRNAEEAEGVGEIGRMLDEAHAQARALARGLSPVSLEEGGLVSGLEELAESLSLIYGVECTLRANGKVALDDPDSATHLYRIAQEAATNAARHAQPNRVELVLEQRGKTITLWVKDDGVGIEAERTDRGGMGIPIMRRRASMLNGSLEVVSGSDGTQVICAFPVARQPSITLPSIQA
jgi:PAS domain S-box-containing protein